MDRLRLFSTIVVAVGCLVLTACGSSSKSPTATTTATAAGNSSANASTSTSTSATKTGTTAARPPERTPLRECLRKQGITLPARKPGQRVSPGGSNLPPGITRQQLSAAFEKCARKAPKQLKARPLRLQPAANRALGEFAACMRKNGVNLAPPNTSGKGPILDTKGIDAASATFRAAEVKCRSLLISSFRARAK